jgi:hypothetical protein
MTKRLPIAYKQAECCGCEACTCPACAEAGAKGK